MITVIFCLQIFILVMHLYDNITLITNLIILTQYIQSISVLHEKLWCDRLRWSQTGLKLMWKTNYQVTIYRRFAFVWIWRNKLTHISKWNVVKSTQTQPTCLVMSYQVVKLMIDVYQLNFTEWLWFVPLLDYNLFESLE